MDKLLIALVAALLGAGGAYVALTILIVEDASKDAQLARAASQTSLQQKVQESGTTEPNFDDNEFRRLRREYLEYKSKFESMERALNEQSAKYQALENKIIAEQEIEAIQVANSLPPNPEVVLKSKELTAKLADAVAKKDGELVVSILGDLVRLGPSAYPAYFEAWKSVYGAEADFNFWQINRTFGNSLWNTNNYLFGDLKNHILNNPSDPSIPASLIRASIYGIDRSSDRSPEDRFKLLLDVSRNAYDDKVRESAGEQLSRVRDASLIPQLNTLLLNTDLSATTRAAVINNLASYDRDNVNWTEIERLANDSDPIISGAARRVSISRNPPVTGYLIEQVFDGQAKEKGILVGDILTRYDGRVVDDADIFREVRGQHQPTDEIAVELYRNGSHLTIYLTASQMGIDGDIVRRK